MLNSSARIKPLVARNPRLVQDYLQEVYSNFFAMLIRYCELNVPLGHVLMLRA